jgi:integrase/recombinase XerD
VSTTLSQDKAGIATRTRFAITDPQHALLFEAFLDHERPLRSSQGNETLRKTARYVIATFEREDLDLIHAGYQDALAFQKHTLERGVSIGTATNDLKVARRFFQFLLERNLVLANPFAELPRPRVPKTISRNVLSEAEMYALLERLSHFDEEPNAWMRARRYRVHVVAETAYSTGARIAELAALRPEDIDLVRGLVTIRQGKGGKDRVAFLTQTAADVLRYYLETGREASRHTFANDSLFGAGYRRLGEMVRVTLREVCPELDTTTITTHGFRHSLGWHLLRRGCDMRYIQAILGHERIGTTQVYTRVEKEELRAVLDAFHPRSMARTRGGD